MKNSPDPFIALDEAGVITEWNHAAERLFGWLRSEVVGRSLAEVLIPPDASAQVGALQWGARGQDDPVLTSAVELPLLHRDAHLITVELSVERLEADGRVSFNAFLRDVSAKRAAAAALQASEERLRLLVDGTPDYGIFMLDRDGIIVTWNLGGQRLTGYPEEEVVGRHFSMLFTAEQRSEGTPADELARASARGRCEQEAWRRRKDGSQFWANVVLTALHDGAGRLNGFSKVIRDITERRQAAEALQASEERLRLLVDGTPDYAIFMLDPDGIVLTWNLGGERLKGYVEAEVVGRHFSIFYTEQQRAQGHPAQALACAVAEGRYEEEAWRVRKDGSQFWANVVLTALHDQDGRLRGFSKVTRDNTERRTAGQALQVSEERFRRAFRDAPIGVCLVDLQGRFQQVNPALAALTGYPVETLLTMRFQDLSHPEDLATDTEAFLLIARGEQPEVSRDKRYVKADGSVVWVAVHVVPILDAAGTVTAVLGHAQDITSRRLYEEQLLERADHDPLTGLANRALFGRELGSHLDRCRRYGAAGSVLMLDLDHFKTVNDSFGHHTGDDLIISMATALRSRLRSADVVARLGGDEFAILLPEGGLAEAELVAGAILEQVRHEVIVRDRGRSQQITTSVGIAVIEDPSLAAHEILAAADAAMYDAKDAGRDRYSTYTGRRDRFATDGVLVNLVDRGGAGSASRDAAERDAATTNAIEP